MIGATFCSGIGAPEIAAPWVDWRLASEIEPFPRAVLQERFGYRLPDDHTRIEWRGKPADHCPDGPQYKAYGNSMAVPVIRWIMDRMRRSIDRNRNEQ